MIGLIHELLFDFIDKNFGAEALQAIKSSAEVPPEQEYRIDTYYSDDEWQRLLTTTVEASGLSSRDAEWAFAAYCGEDLVLRFPGFWKGVSTAKEMVNRRIHFDGCSSE